MSKIFKAVTTVVTVGVVAVVGKVVYDVMMDKKRREEEDFEFFNDIDDDFDYITKASAGGTVKDPKPTVAQTEAPKAAKVTAGASPTKSESKPKTTAKPKATVKTQTAAKGNVNGITCQDVIDCTANVLNVSAEDILSKSRKGDVANARRVAIYLCANNLGVSNSVICEEFGGIGASSVSNAKKAVADKIAEDDGLAADVESIADELKSLEASFKK